MNNDTVPAKSNKPSKGAKTAARVSSENTKSTKIGASSSTLLPVGTRGGAARPAQHVNQPVSSNSESEGQKVARAERYLQRTDKTAVGSRDADVSLTTSVADTVPLVQTSNGVINQTTDSTVEQSF